jgi:RNA:NAD 2'-phosphotransferase (TPT1/KptA family)
MAYLCESAGQKMGKGKSWVIRHKPRQNGIEKETV